jgi:hypothetical protein
MSRLRQEASPAAGRLHRKVNPDSAVPQRTASTGYVTAKQLKKYPDVIVMWQRRFDTQAIADELKLPEHQVHVWVINFRELGREAA